MTPSMLFAPHQRQPLPLLLLFVTACCWCGCFAPVSVRGQQQQQQQQQDGPPPLVTVRLLPRSQWDRVQTYEPARIVATRAVRICQKLDVDGGACTQETEAWTTAVCRDPPWKGYFQESEKLHTLAKPHMFELYRTYDNRTYQEIPLTGISTILHNHPPWPVSDRNTRNSDGEITTAHHSNEEDRMQLLEHIQRRSSSNYGVGEPLQPEDFALMELARIAAYGTTKKLVYRWDMGRLWPIPIQHWNVGERALHTGEHLTVEVLPIAADLLDDRPLYISTELVAEEEEEK